MHAVCEAWAARGSRPGCGPSGQHQLTRLPLCGADEREACIAPAPDGRRKMAEWAHLREAWADGRSALAAQREGERGR